MADLMQQARELLPCPFCGCAATLRVGERMLVDAHVICEGCSAEGPGFGADATEGDFTMEALEAWNRRAAPDGPATHYHCAEGIQGTLSRLRRYAKHGDNKNTLQGQTMEEAAAFIEHALAARPQGVNNG